MSVVELNDYRVSRLRLVMPKQIALRRMRPPVTEFDFCESIEDTLTGFALLTAALAGASLVHFGTPAGMWRDRPVDVIIVGAVCAGVYSLFCCGKVFLLGVKLVWLIASQRNA